MLSPTAVLRHFGEPWSGRLKRTLPGQVARAPPNTPNDSPIVLRVRSGGSRVHEGSSV